MELYGSNPVREIPIIFKGEMVRAIGAGQKTVTRRVMRHQPIIHGPDSIEWHHPRVTETGYCHTNVEAFQRLAAKCCSYGEDGDVLWVREAVDGLFGCEAKYMADGRRIVDAHPRRDKVWAAATSILPNRIVPPIHMPRWASRYLLRRVGPAYPERLQAVTETEAIAEGVTGTLLSSARDVYRELWDKINASPKPVLLKDEVLSYVSYPWEAIRSERTYRGKPWSIIGDPFVWRVGFELIAEEQVAAA